MSNSNPTSETRDLVQETRERKNLETSIKDQFKKYRSSEKTGHALFDLITSLKKHFSKFENEDTQNTLKKVNATENEIKMLRNHWNAPKSHFY